MTNDGQERPSRRAGAIMASAILLLYASLILTAYLFHRYSSIYKDLGMTELPYPTTMAVGLIEATKQWWWVMGVGFIAAAALAWSGYLGRIGWMGIAFVLFVALTLPAILYVVLESPLTALRAHLGR